MPLSATLLSRGPDRAEYALAVPAGHAAFQGHFPGDPVLPGVVQVDWAIRLGQDAFGALGQFQGLDQIKFLAPVRPGQELQLTLDRAAGRLRFSYRCAGAVCASGSVRFDGAP